jgi:uncharacterized membrane protein YcaP (DUF421 family)
MALHKEGTMKKEEIHFGDINRWLFGQTNAQFMIEVFIRTILIYIILLVVVRLMGKRMSGQITLTEIAVMITLGAIVSPAMQLPDRGLCFGIVGLLVALFFQRGYNYLGVKSKRLEEITQGSMSLLVKDGELNLPEMSKASITKQQLYSMLREQKVQNLSKVKRAYFEACGVLSVFEDEEKKPGLPILPQSDPAIVTDLQHQVDHGTMACSNCGHVQQVESKNDACEVCNESKWIDAYEVGENK